MNKIHFFIAVAMVQSFLVESKDYTFLPRLNNETSARCNAVEAARFYRGDLERSCDEIEEILREYAADADRHNVFFQHIERMLESKSASERLELALKEPTKYLGIPHNSGDPIVASLKSESIKDAFRNVLSDKDAATQLEAYRSFKRLARTLNHQKREEIEQKIKDDEKIKAQQKAERKEKRAQEKLTKF